MKSLNDSEGALEGLEVWELVEGAGRELGAGSALAEEELSVEVEDSRAFLATAERWEKNQAKLAFEDDSDPISNAEDRPGRRVDGVSEVPPTEGVLQVEVEGSRVEHLPLTPSACSERARVKEASGDESGRISSDEGGQVRLAERAWSTLHQLKEVD